MVRFVLCATLFLSFAKFLALANGIHQEISSQQPTYPSYTLGSNTGVETVVQSIFEFGACPGIRGRGCLTQSVTWLK
jgi:hypothetical protein